MIMIHLHQSMAKRILRYWIVKFCALLYITSPSLVLAQLDKVDFNNYKPIYCEGDLPVNLRSLSSKKAIDAMNQIQNTGVTGRERRTEELHAVEVSFFEDQLLSSGQVLFGNPLSNYVEKVGENLLKDNKQLLEEVQFYVLRSHIPNAYTTSNGLIFVSIGLLVRLENESQLAVILAHEIQHYIKKHSLLQYKENRKVMSSSSRNSNFENKLKAIYRFSKDQEFEADDLGYEMLKNTQYDLNEGLYVFEMLKYTDYPFLETPYSIDSLSSENYVFPQSVRDLAAASIKSILETEAKNKSIEDADIESTHPSLNQRILILRDRIAKLDMTGKKKFIISESEFNYMQKIARHELLLLYMRRSDYGQSFYLTKVMELLYGKSLFLSRVKAMSIYALAEHRFKGKNLKDFGCSVTDNKGEWRNFFAEINSLTDKELGALAARIVWQEWTKYPNDEFLMDVRDRTFKTLQYKGRIFLNDFLAFVPYKKREVNAAPNSAVTAPTHNTQPIKSDVSVKQNEENGSNLLKNPRSRSQNSVTATVVNSAVVPNVELPYFYGSLIDFPKQEELKKYLENVRIDFDLLSQSTSKLSSSQRRAKFEQEQKEKYSRPNPDVQGLVVFQPQVTFTNGLIRSNKKKLFSEEKYREKLTKQWQNVAWKSGLNIKILTNTAGSDITTQTLNDYAQLNDWMMERLNNDTGEMLLFNSQYIAEPMKDFQTDLLCWTGVDYKIVPRDIQLDYLVYSIFYPPAMIYYLYWQLQTDSYLKEYTVVYDTKTSKVKFQRTKFLETKMTDPMLKAQIYETLYEIRHSR